MLLPKPIVLAGLVVAFLLGYLIIWIDRYREQNRPMVCGDSSARDAVVNKGAVINQRLA